MLNANKLVSGADAVDPDAARQFAFVGFGFAAIAIGALVPSAIMSIGAAKLFTRNLWKPFFRPQITPAQETTVAKIASQVVKLGALLFVIFMPIQYAIDFQLLGGNWILQTFPAVVLGLYRVPLRGGALFLVWLAGMISGTLFFISAGLKPAMLIQGIRVIYIAIVALILNLVINFAGSLFAPAERHTQNADHLPRLRCDGSRLPKIAESNGLRIAIPNSTSRNVLMPRVAL